jgi:hypothetical protein
MKSPWDAWFKKFVVNTAPRYRQITNDQSPDRMHETFYPEFIRKRRYKNKPAKLPGKD